MNELILPEILELVEKRKWQELTARLADWREPEIADLLLHVAKTERVLLYRTLPRRQAARVFAHLDHEHQDALLSELGDEDTRHLLAHMKPDDRTALLEELPAEVTQRLLKLLSPEDLVEARQLLGYPEESVGRLMTPNYVSVSQEMTIAEAIDSIRRSGVDSETFNLVYVVGEDGRLLDGLRLRAIIMADPEDKVESIMDHSYVSLSAFDDREKAVQMIQRYDLYALPVVDSEGVLLGIVTVDDVMDVAQAEATEDFYKSAAVSPLEMPYSSATAPALFSKRIGWLTVLILVNLVSARLIAGYEEYLMQYFVLAFFMPLLIDSGGNAGSQSATLMIRALATGDLQLQQWGRALLKELAVGLLLGGVTGVLTYALGVYRGGHEIGLVVGLSMMAIVLLANLIGVILPFSLVRAKLDPAVASSPLITSMMDILGLGLYFWIGTMILSLN
ncbi:MAG TPA: magnesium transporter [Opitutales bacterium]|nr:magnesium transporter [Opitutales bacterium]